MEQETLARMKRTVDLVFGTGKYGHLGKTVALIEIRKTLAEVGLNDNSGCFE